MVSNPAADMSIGETLPNPHQTPTFLRSYCKYGIVAVIFAGRLAAQDAIPRQVPPDMGAVTESGKFQAKEARATPVPDPMARLAELGIKLDGETVKIGLVELDRKTRSVSFPATVHMTEGVIEYAVVHANGKIHESLFVTDALPQDIHVACLLAGWKKAQEKVSSPILIEVSWKTNGPPRSERLENLVAFAKDNPQGKQSGHLASGPWNYTGSLVDSAGFAATREGSIVSVISDPAALAGNPRPDMEDDTLHVPNAGLLPKLGIPVKIILRPVSSPTNPSP